LGIGAATIVAATSATTAAATTTAGTAIFAGAGFVDGEVTAAKGFAVGGFDRGGAFSGAAHGDKGKTAGAAGGVIGHESDIGASAVLAKEVFEVVFGGVEGKISYVQFHMVCLDLRLRKRIALTELFPRNSGFKSPLK
jgi:hypothetical protein